LKKRGTQFKLALETAKAAERGGVHKDEIKYPGVNRKVT
jgi:hypothetical protein